MISLKSIQLWFYIFLFIIRTSIAYLLIQSKKKKLHYFTHMTSLYSKKILDVLGIKVNVKYIAPEANEQFQHVFYVANHVSYLDILIISSLFPCIFITSVEVQKTFFIGFIATLGGSVFVDRKKKSGVQKEIEMIGKKINQGFCVTLFPEATSSNGEDLLPFKPSLLETAVQSKTPIVPLCIKYVQLNSQPITKKNRDMLFYYGDIKIFPHLLQLPTIKCAEVNVSVFPIMHIQPKTTRKELSESIYTLIRNYYLNLDIPIK